MQHLSLTRTASSTRESNFSRKIRSFSCLSTQAPGSASANRCTSAHYTSQNYVLIIYGVQFAYNEISFMLIRLLQNFSSISLDPSAQPPETRPPVSWAGHQGRKGIEQFRPKAHLTMYSYVCTSLYRVFSDITHILRVGWSMGHHARGSA